MILPLSLIRLFRRVSHIPFFFFKQKFSCHLPSSKSISRQENLVELIVKIVEFYY